MFIVFSLLLCADTNLKLTLKDDGATPAYLAIHNLIGPIQQITRRSVAPCDVALKKKNKTTRPGSL